MVVDQRVTRRIRDICRQGLSGRMACSSRKVQLVQEVSHGTSGWIVIDYHRRNKSAA